MCSKTLLSEILKLCQLNLNQNVVRDGRLSFLSVHTRGVPRLHLHPIILPLVPCPFLGGGVPQWLVPGQGDYPMMGVCPPPARSEWGYPQARDGVPLPPPQDRTADGVLNTPRSVCLLRLRRRTFLLIMELNYQGWAWAPEEWLSELDFIRAKRDQSFSFNPKFEKVELLITEVLNLV